MKKTFMSLAVMVVSIIVVCFTSFASPAMLDCEAEMQRGLSVLRKMHEAVLSGVDEIPSEMFSPDETLTTETSYGLSYMPGDVGEPEEVQWNSIRNGMLTYDLTCCSQFSSWTIVIPWGDGLSTLSYTAQIRDGSWTEYFNVRYPNGYTEPLSEEAKTEIFAQ